MDILTLKTLGMPPVQGGDLRAALDGPQRGEYLWRKRGAGIAADIARGLAYIHTTGVVHRCISSYDTSLTSQVNDCLWNMSVCCLLRTLFIRYADAKNCSDRLTC